MSRKGLVLCAILGFLGLLSALLGFLAEAKRIKGSQVKYSASSPYECVYPRSPALALGFSAAVALMIAQVIINVATGCICCAKRSPQQSASKWTLGFVCFVLNWFTFVIAFILLLTGAALNEEHGQEYVYVDLCYVVKPGVFAGAATLSLTSVILGISYYYLTSNSTKDNSVEAGIVMGHPQQDPVFVHHDTYARRQLS